MEKEILYVKKLNPEAIIPKRATPEAAGFDLHAVEDSVIEPHSTGLIPTGLQIMVPIGYYGRVAPRSSLALKFSIDVGAGVVDSDYRGEVKVVLFNLSSKNGFQIKKGDRIAQLILEKICLADVQEVDSLTETQRGAGGFGSTGK